MATFQYIALDAQGQQQQGTIVANSVDEASAQVREMALFPTQVTEVSSASKAGKASKAKTQNINTRNIRLKPVQVMNFTRQLSILINAGLPLIKSLSILSSQQPNKVMKTMIERVSQAVQSGGTLSDGLAQYPRIFDDLFVNMVRAGEAGGIVDVVLDRLGDYREKAEALRKKIKSAMTYPIIVLVVAALIMSILMVVVVPQFKEMFEDSESELPALSTAVFNFSENMIANPVLVPNFIWLGGFIFLIVVGFKAFGKTASGKRFGDRIVLRLPLLGDVQRKNAIAKFARTLGTLITSGVSILESLRITKETAGNVIIAESIGMIYDKVREGDSMVSPMKAANIFPEMAISMVEVGEETGQLPDMLLKVADVYEEEVKDSVDTMTTILQPLMIVFLAGIVAVIVFAIFAPLAQIINDLDSAMG